ncbi:hypothetical protein [Halorussus sp. MSC15.2]|uniref:hypothetical protein n=1 Tax=Halorussus sp. MSC15.2 TaxID=2283638 RepID=UPI0013D595F3|nr:hypothetical protein [Halorussus sp. MSC15.2]NEU56671.1 hypothetical protein [Halorussus sp. MSC15.2]
MSDEERVSEPDDVTLKSLTEKLHVKIPFSRSYVFNGQKGAFIIKYDRQRPIDRVLDESDD